MGFHFYNLTLLRSTAVPGISTRVIRTKLSMPSKLASSYLASCSMKFMRVRIRNKNQKDKQHINLKSKVGQRAWAHYQPYDSTMFEVINAGGAAEFRYALGTI